MESLSRRDVDAISMEEEQRFMLDLDDFLDVELERSESAGIVSLRFEIGTSFLPDSFARLLLSLGEESVETEVFNGHVGEVYYYDGSKCFESCNEKE